MTIIEIDSARKELAELIKRARSGEEIVIADHDRPVARLEPLGFEGKDRVPGRLKDKLTIPQGLFDPLPEDELHRWLGETD